MKKKLATLSVLGTALAKVLLTGRANKTPPMPPKSVIVPFLTKNVGDMIFATSVFRALKEKYPSCHLSVVGSKKNALTLAGNKDVDTYIVDPGEAWQLVSLLKSTKADYGFSLATGSLDIAAMILAGVKTIACFDVQNAPGAHTLFYKLFKRFCIQIPYYVGRYCSQEYLKLLEPLGIFSKNTGKYLFYTEETVKKVRVKFLEQGVDLHKEKIAAISPGAGTKSKLWPVERFALAADFLAAKGFRIAVIGGPGDKEEVISFKSKTKSHVLDASDLGLEEMFYFISQCKLLMANDSGPIYMAESFKVPTLVVVGPTDEFEHPPHGPLNAVVTPDRNIEAPEMRGHIMGYSEEHAREQIEQVTVEEVLKVLKILIQKI
ncbi:MAG: glycosyltransferase family 9 protein [bacterium]|nr:glycosyltransferase family 9 protein [bacterium]